ncbi:MAG TPA: NADH-quinone oxidoreductase subunit NuoG [Anaerolineae bacterium]|nr:NADH-quinone oxidoreductase subunit NuoG [Anaerolineae bacterium]HNS52902.1 NADH-quinone oxidoreductase subunit NuoG [Anaerolineae bacterium]
MTEERTVVLTIDGQEVRCPAGWTIYQAATAAGIHIPTFCNHPKLVPVGACRTCLVEVESMRGLQTSCTVPVRQGLVVRVHTSPAAVKARHAMIEFLLTNHPLDCPVCDKGGECVLQDQAMADGPGVSRYVEEKRHKSKRQPLGDRIVLDQERCVLCWRCIRFLDEWADDHQLDLFGRGAATRLDTFAGRPLLSQWQGNTIELCPVGALTSRAFRFEARVWELTNTPSVCTLCAVGCSTTIGVKNNVLRRITPRENMQVNDAWICDTGRFSHRLVDPEDRLTQPLVRREGRLEPVPWAGALDLVARRFAAVLQEKGPAAVGALGSARATNEANYLLQRFVRAAWSCNNIDHLGRVPVGAQPLHSLPDLEEKDLILLIDFDPSAEAPLVELWLKKAVLRHGAKVIVAHPMPIELARYGGPWLSLRPGSEGSLLQGLARAVLEGGLDPKAIRATNLEEFRTWVKEHTPDQIERTTGVPAGALVAAARLLVEAKRPAILYGRQVASPLPDSGTTAWDGLSAALANLAVLLGNAEIAFVAGECNTLGAREMGVVPGQLPGGQALGDGQVRSQLAGLWGGKLAAERGLDLEGMMAEAEAGHLHALWVLESNPSGGALPADALARVPFLVVSDQVATETTALAQVVLPVSTLAETDGTLINLTGRLLRLHEAKRPPAQVQPAWRLIAEVAQRMLEGKRRRAWEFGGAAGVFAEIAKVVPSWRGLTLDAIEEDGWQPRPGQAGQSQAARRAFVHVDLGQEAGR